MAVENFTVEAGHIVLFARAIGDKNPIYYDANHAKSTEPGGIIAPPTFVQASAQFDPDYALRPTIGKPWMGSGKTPSGLMAPAPAEDSGDSAGADSGGKSSSSGAGLGLHAEQHFEYHRQLKPGDVLSGSTKNGEPWEKQGRRGGKLLFTEQITEYRDQNGELVITARSVGVQTERAASQD
ncbi:MAG: MaoC family dehydratase N-terminal domain-containing protein [Desulfobacterales bacterium]